MFFVIEMHILGTKPCAMQVIPALNRVSHHRAINENEINEKLARYFSENQQEKPYVRKKNMAPCV